MRPSPPVRRFRKCEQPEQHVNDSEIVKIYDLYHSKTSEVTIQNKMVRR